MEVLAGVIGTVLFLQLIIDIFLEYPWVFILIILGIILLCFLTDDSDSTGSRSSYDVSSVSMNNYKNVSPSVSSSNRTLLYESYGSWVLGTAIDGKLFKGSYHPEVNGITHIDGHYSSGKVYGSSYSGTYFDTPIGSYRNGMIFIGEYEKLGVSPDGYYRNGYIYRGTGFNEERIASYEGDPDEAAALAILFLFNH